MADAHYIHGSLYKFDADSLRQVIASFNAQINDATARCWYDGNTHVFHLTCPSSSGPQADRVLKEVTCRYVAKEREALDRDECDTSITRFPESEMHAITSTDLEERATRTEPTMIHSQQTPAFQTVILHAVQDSAAGVQFFTLQTLPDGFLERVLVPEHNIGAESKKLTSAVKNGLTCRAVRWDAHQVDHFFNGCVGAPITASAAATQAMLELVGFVPLGNDQPTANDLDNAVADVQAQYWKFKGRAPTKAQFLAGMGEIELIEYEDPNQPPEIPADAQKFINRPDENIAYGGRIRVPKRIETHACELEKEDSSDDESLKISFSQLLNGNVGKKESEDDDKESEVSDLYADSTANKRSFKDLLLGDANGDIRRAGSGPCPTASVPVVESTSFSSLFTKHKGTDRLAQTTIPAQLSATLTNSASGSPSKSPDRSSGCTSSLSGPAQVCPHVNNAFPNYGGRYSKIDQAGLTSIASNEATWEIENRSTPDRKTKRSGITRRQHAPSTNPFSSVPTSRSSDALSVSQSPVSRRIQRSPAPSRYPSYDPMAASVQGSPKAEPQMRSWSNQIVAKQVRQGTLIDIGSGDQSVDPRTARPLSAAAHSSGSQTRTPSFPIQGKTVPLFKIPDRPVVARQQMQISAGQNGTHQVVRADPATEGPTHARNGTSNDESIHETLLIDLDQPMSMRFTMRQKAAKKGKGSKKSSKSAGSTSNFPKPDPLPKPLKAGSSQKANSPSVGAIQGGQLPTTIPAGTMGMVPPQQDEPALPKTEVLESLEHDTVKPRTPIEKLTQAVIHRTNEVSDAELHVQFGMVLIKHQTNKDFCKAVYTAEVAQKKLQESLDDVQTVFIPRLTTSATDARHMLDLVPGGRLKGAVEYEIHTKNAEGTSGLIKFDPNFPQDFIVCRPASELGVLYLQYPVYVWDAKVVIRMPNFDEGMVNAAQDFIGSIKTVNGPPSFNAMVPSNSFNVDRVIAKRIFSKTIETGVELRVTEMQELFRESMRSPIHNLRASALPPDDMIANHRLWWECEVCISSLNAVPGAELQAIADELVGGMDGVGFNNVGPWQKREVEMLPAPSVEPSIW